MVLKVTNLQHLSDGMWTESWLAGGLQQLPPFQILVILQPMRFLGKWIPGCRLVLQLEEAEEKHIDDDGSEHTFCNGSGE